MSVALLPAKDAFSGQPQTQCLIRFPCYVAVPVRDPQRPLWVQTRTTSLEVACPLPPSADTVCEGGPLVNLRNSA
jgi:hypothetical protein